MGLLVDISKEYNYTMTDLKDVYIRIENLQYFPKYFALRANVTGFVNPESGYLMKKKEIADVKAVENFFFTNEALNGPGVESFNRDNMIPPQTGQEPQPVFRDYFTIYLKDAEGEFKPGLKDLKLCDMNQIFAWIYDKLRRYETRFTNVRDVVSDPEVV